MAIPSEVVILDPLHIEVQVEEVLRYLGYPAGARPGERACEGIQAAIQAARLRQRPRGMYAVHRIASMGRHSLELDQGTVFTGTIGEFLEGATHAAVFVATAGAEVELLEDEAARGKDPMMDLALHAVGAQLAEAAVELLMEDLRRRLDPGEALTLRYSPGYCGIHLRQQSAVFGLLDTRRIRVELLPSMLMKPLKSVSGVVGIGPASAVHAYGNPCDACPMTTCAMRR
jgi:hypothetical protein